ncbi:MAG TPA: tyrosine-type recombinase/integrase [Armatimonadota bacterium]|nr:tyrosine-type recombinase/integrase [Armatimonadota bacterium]
MEKVQPIRKLEQIARIKRNLKTPETAVWYALFGVGVNTNLRVSDLRNLTWAQVWMDDEREFRNHILLTEQKTGKKRRIKINPNVLESLAYLLENIPAPERTDPIFRNSQTREVYSREHIARRISAEAKKIGIQDQIAIHSLRKTWAYHAIVTFHQDITIVQAALNHATQKQTMDYVGVTEDDIEIVHDTVML